MKINKNSESFLWQTKLAARVDYCFVMFSCCQYQDKLTLSLQNKQWKELNEAKNKNKRGLIGVSFQCVSVVLEQGLALHLQAC